MTDTFYKIPGETYKKVAAFCSFVLFFYSQFVFSNSIEIQKDKKSDFFYPQKSSSEKKYTQKITDKINSPLQKKQKIYVKFQNNSSLLKLWNSQNKSGELNPLSNLLGFHRTKPFVRKNIIEIYKKKILRKSNNIQKENIFSIENIAVVEIENPPIPIEILVKKLETLADVEYAELVPKVQLLYEPLDSLAGEQTHLQQVKAPESWDYLLPNEPIIIAIVDTGIDFEHPDLAANIWKNLGETGSDANGNSKENNGLDDDINGFIDDYLGWDFYDDDNNIKPVHGHGTHVAGLAGAVHNTIGTAGVTKNVKLMAVKITGDNEPTNIERNGYEGILYAAAMGAAVINCSWGGFKYSVAETEAVKFATEMGAIVVAAAGNSGENDALFPARLPQVLGVSAVYDNDMMTSFTSFNKAVDVSAPGYKLLSTAIGNNYNLSSGTSMASPVVAAVAAQVKNNNPNFTPAQIIAQVKATTDDISSQNPNYQNLLGTGRVNALRAISENDAKWIEISSYKVNNSEKNIVFGNEKENAINIVADVHNFLKSAAGVYAKLHSEQLDFEQDSIYIADEIAENSIISDGLKFSVFQKKSIDSNGIIDIYVTFYNNSNKKIGSSYIIIYAAEYWHFCNFNNIGITYTNDGRFAYLDYPANEIGYGMSYKNYENLLYQSGIIIASDSANVFSNITGENYETQAKDFLFENKIEENFLADKNIFTAKYSYTNLTAHLKIEQEIFASKADSLANTIFVKYRVTNKYNKQLENLYLSQFHDWEVLNVEQNKIETDTNNVVFISNFYDNSKNLNIAVKLITNQIPTYKALSINGDFGEESIYKGFSNAAKWNFLQELLPQTAAAASSTPTDIAMLLGGKVANIAPDSSVTFVFVITASEDKTLAGKQISAAENFYHNEIETGNIEESPAGKYDFFVSPNPVTNNINYKLENIKAGKYVVSLVDIAGNKKYILEQNLLISGESLSGEFNISQVNSGTYYLVFENSQTKYIKKIVTLK